MQKIPNDSDQNFRILTLDGGGTHALAYLPILIEIEKRLGCEVSLVNRQAFDLIVGTSTGTIVAMAICCGVTAAEIRNAYRELAARIFGRGKNWPLRRLLFHKYSSRHLLESLQQFLAKKEFGDPTWADFASRLAGKIEMVVTLWNISDGRTVILSTNLASNDERDKFLENARLSSIITACCSAPTYFPPRRFITEVPPPRCMDFCDAGITGLNNPAALSVYRVLKLSQVADRRIQILSLGSGAVPAGQNREAAERRWILDEVRHLVEIMFASTSSLMRDFFGAFGGRLGIQDYVRTEPVRGIDEKLDAASKAELDAIECKFIDRNTRFEHLAFGNPERQIKEADNILSAKAVVSLCGIFWPCASGDYHDKSD